MRNWLIGFFLIIPLFSFSQSDTLQVDTGKSVTPEHVLSPGQIASRSAYLPGYGQWTNKQYWKTPIMAGAVGGGLYASVHFSRKYSAYEIASISRIGADSLLTDQFAGILTNQELFERNVQFGDYKRYSIFFTIYAHGINIFDAYAKAVIDKTNVDHSPTRAAYYAALFPGLGQVYNRKYWKVPIVYAAVGTAVGFSIYFNNLYNDFKLAYSTRSDNDPDSFYETEFTLSYPTTSLKSESDQWKNYRDMSYIATVGVYLLTIVDAIVDAHLYGFNVDDDLSHNHWMNRFEVSPMSTGFSQMGSGAYQGVSLRFTF